MSVAGFFVILLVVARCMARPTDPRRGRARKGCWHRPSFANNLSVREPLHAWDLLRSRPAHQSYEAVSDVHTSTATLARTGDSYVCTKHRRKRLSRAAKKRVLQRCGCRCETCEMQLEAHTTYFDHKVPLTADPSGVRHAVEPRVQLLGPLRLLPPGQMFGRASGRVL
jgi:hypothetical protein